MFALFFSAWQPMISSVLTIMLFYTFKLRIAFYKLPYIKKNDIFKGMQDYIARTTNNKESDKSMCQLLYIRCTSITER